MNIIICGAGEVGRHAAEVLAPGASITMIDLSRRRLAEVEELMDIRVMTGSGTHADALIEAGCASADMFLAATNVDEVNLLAASLAKAVGARLTVARVHHGAYLDQRSMDYREFLHIDHLVCPEQATAVTIAQTLRTPGAMAIEHLARGQVDMQQIVCRGGRAENAPLMAVRFPGATRVAAIERHGVPMIPDGRTVLLRDDVVTLIGDKASFEKACRLLDPAAGRRQRIVVWGGSTMGVWLCRALRSQAFAVRLYEADRDRAHELAAKLDWVTVIQADLSDPGLLEDDRIEQADAFVAASNDDEHNILVAARARSLGVGKVIATLQRPTYLHLIEHIGIDAAFSPRSTAAQELRHMLDQSPVRRLATLADGIAEVYEVRVSATSGPAIGKPLREIRFPQRVLVALIEREGDVVVPGASDTIQLNDTLVVIAPAGMKSELMRLFGV